MILCNEGNHCKFIIRIINRPVALVYLESQTMSPDTSGCHINHICKTFTGITLSFMFSAYTKWNTEMFKIYFRHSSLNL